MLKKTLICSFVLLVCWGGHSFYQEKYYYDETLIHGVIKKELGAALDETKPLPEKLRYKQHDYKLEYTFDADLQAYITRVLKRLRSDYSAIVVIDNATGAIIAANGKFRKIKNIHPKFAFTSSHPSASVFKIVTAADLLEEDNFDAYSQFSYRGRASTLYRYQLDRKWRYKGRTISLSRAFAKSNNVIFGKIAVYHSSALDLYESALKFGFNQPLLSEVDTPVSRFKLPTTKYNMAEMGSGYNRDTEMSSLHGALIASIVANDGLYRRPRFLEAVYGPERELVWSPRNDVERPVEAEVAQSLASMMEETVASGTARRAFRRMGRKMKQQLSIGGKTGRITGGQPYGRRDWFVGFAKPHKADLGAGISLCVMQANRKRWYVRSSRLAKDVIEYYYKRLLRPKTALNRNYR